MTAASVRGSMRSRERAKWEPRGQNTRLSPLPFVAEFDEHPSISWRDPNEIRRTFCSSSTRLLPDGFHEAVIISGAMLDADNSRTNPRKEEETARTFDLPANARTHAARDVILA